MAQTTLVSFISLTLIIISSFVDANKYANFKLVEQHVTKSPDKEAPLKKMKKEEGRHENIDGVCVYVKKVFTTMAACEQFFEPLDQCKELSYLADTFDTEPYRQLILDHVKQSFRQYRESKSCANADINRFEVADIAELKLKRGSEHLNLFTFPFLAYKESPIVQKHHFLPVIDPSGAFYIARRKRVAVSSIINQCVELWPLLVFAIFMSLVAGFFIWMLEFRINADEFPPSFFRGWFDGVWWAIVSMTTVGYGDKAPRTIGGRLFSIVWITIGIVVFCILAGELTAVILDAKSGDEHSMISKNVGTLDRLYEKSLVALYGGLLKPTDKSVHKNELEQMHTLTQKLWNSSLDGVLLDKMTYRYMQDRLQNSADPSINYFFRDTVITDIPHKGRKVSYGLLFRVRPTRNCNYDIFDRVLEDKNFLFQMNATKSFQTVLKTTEEDDENDFYRVNFVGNVDIIGVTMAVMLVVGILYEYFRRRRENSRREIIHRRDDARICE